MVPAPAPGRQGGVRRRSGARALTASDLRLESFVSNPDIRTLGRIGQPLRGAPTGYPRRRRARVPRAVARGLARARTGAVGPGATAGRQAAPTPPVAALPAPQRPVTDRAVVQRTSRDATRPGAATVFARADGLALTLPSDAAVAIGFHEADGPQALPLTPSGRLVANDNPTAFRPPADSQGPGYRGLAPLGEARSATGAVDVAVGGPGAVVAPVDGRVVEVAEYPLAGGTRDWRVAIEPQGRPDLTVVLTRLRDPRVAVGDAVRAGRTPLGRGRVLPFATPLDGLFPRPPAQTSLRVQPAVRAEPLDPNAPALSAADGRSGPSS